MHRLIKAICTIAAEEFGQERADRIAARAQRRYEDLCRENASEPKTLRAHTFNYDSRMNMASLQALRQKVDLDRIRAVFTSHNGFTDDPQSAFRHIDTIPTLEKGRPFDGTAPYDCFREKEE